MSADIRGKAAANERAGDMSPGEHLRAEIKRLALDQVAVSKATGVSRQSINNIINGRQPISRAMAGKLGRLTGHSPDYWLRASFPSSVRARGDTGASDGGTARSLRAGILVNHQIVRAVKEGVIGLEPFFAENVHAASIDLTLDNIVITADGEKVDLSRKKSFWLKAGHLITVTTKERISFPHDHVGRLGALNRLVRAAIVTSHACQIEPGFEGRVPFCLFNAGRHPFRLRAEEPVIALEIIGLSATPADDFTT